MSTKSCSLKTRLKISKSLLGHKLSKRTRLKIRNSLLGKSTSRKGIKFPAWWRKKLSIAHKGKKLSKKHRLNVIRATKNKWRDINYKIKVSIKISIAQKGKKGNNWQGGISKQKYPIGWSKVLKNQIRNRDGFKCQECGCPQEESIKKLPIHHIDYDKNNVSQLNLITLCQFCHSKTNRNRTYWKNHFIEKIKEMQDVRI